MTKENPVTFHNDVIINNFVGQGRNIVVVTLPYRLGVFGLPNWPGDLERVADRNLIIYGEFQNSRITESIQRSLQTASKALNGRIEKSQISAGIPKRPPCSAIVEVL